MMNRRNFLKSCACAVAAALVGVKAKAEKIVTGVGRGSFQLIDNVGFTMSLDEAYREYAESLEKEAQFIVGKCVTIQIENDGEWLDLV